MFATNFKQYQDLFFTVSKNAIKAGKKMTFSFQLSYVFFFVPWNDYNLYEIPIKRNSCFYKWRKIYF